MRQDSKRQQANRFKKERLKRLLKKARKQPTEKNIRAAISLVDKVVKTGLTHKNKAARLKSRLAKLLTQEGLSPKTKKRAKTGSRKKIKSSENQTPQK